jgi:RNA polymerase primary sigma factor
MKKSQLVDMLTNDLENANIRRLTFQEEHDLALRAQAGDKEAHDRLVNCNVPLAISVARRYAAGYLFILDEIVQDAITGLIRAVPKYNPIHKGEPIRFATYATYWITNQIRMGMSTHYMRLEVPDGAILQQLKLNDFRVGFRLQHGRDPTPREECERFKISERRYKDLQKAGVAFAASFQVGLGEASSNGSTKNMVTKTKREIAAEMIKSPLPLPPEDVIAADYRALIKRHFNYLHGLLKVKERWVLRCRLLADEPRGLRELGVDMGITKERVRQIETQTKRKIKLYFQSVGLAPNM